MANTLGPYQLRGELGRGAMAVVWRAWDPTLEREVALKEPFVAPGTDTATAAELAARFVREAKAAARLNHPGIVTIYSADIYEGRAVICMELIEGETLGEVLSRGALPPAIAVSVLDQLLDALAYAHARGVVHRDIKPDNVFLTPEGRVKLADFGIAHVGSGTALTQAGTMMGTPGYMAPEQITGQPVDQRADLFAAGVLAYEMLTGRNPFGASEDLPATTIMYRVVHEPAPDLPPEALAGVPVDLRSVLACALAKDPSQRIASAQAFRDALAGGALVTASAEGPSLLPHPVYGPAAGVAQTAPRQRNLVPYVVLAVVLALGAGALFVLASGGGQPTPRLPMATTVSATATSTATVTAVAKATPSTAGATSSITGGVEEAASRRLLEDNYARLGQWGDTNTGEIHALAAQFNADPLATTGASQSTTNWAERLLDDVQTARDQLQEETVAPRYRAVAATQLQLYDYCITRVSVIRDACYQSGQGQAIESILEPGSKAAADFTSLYPQGRP